MKIHELIAILQQLPQDDQIHYWGYHNDVEEIDNVRWLVNTTTDIGAYVYQNVWVLTSDTYDDLNDEEPHNVQCDLTQPPQYGETVMVDWKDKP